MILTWFTVSECHQIAWKTTQTNTHWIQLMWRGCQYITHHVVNILPIMLLSIYYPSCFCQYITHHASVNILPIMLLCYCGCRTSTFCNTWNILQLYFNDYYIQTLNVLCLQFFKIKNQYVSMPYISRHLLFWCVWIYVLHNNCFQTQIIFVPSNFVQLLIKSL